MPVSLVYLERTSTGYYCWTGTTAIKSGVTVKKFTLSAGVDAAKAIWRKDASDGTIVCTLTAPANTTVTKEANDNEGWQFPKNGTGTVHVTVAAGTTPACGIDITALPNA